MSNAILTRPYNDTFFVLTADYIPGSGLLAVDDPSRLPAAPTADIPVRLSVDRVKDGAKTILDVSGVSGLSFTGATAAEGKADIPLYAGDVAKIRISAGYIRDLQDAHRALEGSVSGISADLSGTAAEVSGLGASLAAKADDSGVVHRAGDETAAGLKTFSGGVAGPGGALTVAATGTAVERTLVQLMEESVDVKRFGAVGDGLTDDTAAILAAVASLPSDVNALPKGGRVFLSRGVYRVSATIALPHNVTLYGTGRDSSILKSNGTFAGPIASIASFHSRLEDLQVDCADVAGSVGVFSNSANEQSGMSRCMVANFRRAGLRVDGTGSSLFPQNYMVEDCEFYLSATATAPCACVDLLQTFPAMFNRVTCANALANNKVAGSVGVNFGANVGQFHLQSCHFESLETGVNGFTFECAAHHCSFGPNITTGIAIPADSNSFLIEACSATLDGTVGDTITDADRGRSSGAVPVSLYARSGGTPTQQMLLDASPSATQQFWTVLVQNLLQVLGRAMFTNDTSSPNVIVIDPTNFGGAGQGGWISINSAFSNFPNWAKTSTSTSDDALFIRLSPLKYEIRFGAADNSGGADPGTSALIAEPGLVTSSVPLALAVSSDSSAPAGSLYLGSDHLDANSAPKLCRKDASGNVNILG